MASVMSVPLDDGDMAADGGGGGAEGGEGDGGGRTGASSERDKSGFLSSQLLHTVSTIF